MSEILQHSLPYDPMTPRALPGIQPFEEKDWLIVDDAFAGQMGERDRLLRTARPEVLALDDYARPAADELLETVLGLAYPGAGSRVIRRDGVTVDIDRDDPMGTLGRLVQEDFCILQKVEDEHVLTGAILCFPASWMLADKFMRPLIGIHAPVGEYDAGLAARVQRMFNGVQVGRPLWRFNALWCVDASLHQPRRENISREESSAESGAYLRSERQCIVRLPKTKAVIFSIHTFVLARESVLRLSEKPDLV